MDTRSRKSNDLLRRQRLERFWTLNDVADRLYQLCEGEEKGRGDINASMISGWEHGKHQPGLFWQKKLCQLYDKDAIALGFLDPPAFPAPDEAPQTEKEMEISEDVKNGGSVNRREALQEIGVVGAALLMSSQGLLHPQPWERLSNIEMDPLHIDEESVQHFAKLTETCWYLSKHNQLHMAEAVIWAYLPKLAVFAQRYSQYQQTLAGYAAQGYLLAASLAGHRNHLKERYYFSEQALVYGKVAEERNLYVSALKQLAQTLDYQEALTQAIQAYQQALSYLQDVSPLLRSRLYAGLAGAYAQVAQEQEALRYIKLAYEHFPEKPEDDPGFLYVDVDYFVLILWDALTHLDLNRPKEAWNILSRIEALQLQGQQPIEKVRVELLNYQAVTLTDLNELEQGCVSLEQAAKAALALGSERRYNETFQTFQHIQAKWPEESRVRELNDLFVR